MKIDELKKKIIKINREIRKLLELKRKYLIQIKKLQP